jgi:hypothetical protein
MTYYHFSAREGRPPVKLTWYSGGLQPPRPEELPVGEELNAMGGVLYVGSQGKLLHETYGANPRFLPRELDRNRPDVPRRFERVENEAHEMNWARAIKGQVEAVSPFSYAAPLTVAMLLGVVSLKADTQQIAWDAENLRVTNLPEANDYLHREPHDGWALRS